MSPASNPQFKNKAGFTLIELLIVIAVIGILSGIIMVSFDGAKDKARIAKSLQFSNSVQNAIGVDMVGRWNFEKIEGEKVIDTSGYGNDGVVHGATLVPGLEQLGNALSFDGVDDYVDCGNDASLNVGSNDFTVEVWAKATGGVTGRGVINKGSWWSVGYAIQEAYSPANRYYFVVTDSAGYKSIALPLYETWDWTHIVGIKKGNYLEAWVNGAKVGTFSGAIGSLDNSAKKLEIGRSSNSNYFNGLIDDVRIYNSALSFSAIREHYLAGLDKLLAGGQITENDYQQRIAELNSNYVASK